MPSAPATTNANANPRPIQARLRAMARPNVKDPQWIRRSTTNAEPVTAAKRTQSQAGAGGAMLNDATPFLRTSWAVHPALERVKDEATLVPSVRWLVRSAPLDRCAIRWPLISRLPPRDAAFAIR